MGKTRVDMFAYVILCTRVYLLGEVVNLKFLAVYHVNGWPSNEGMHAPTCPQSVQQYVTD